MKQVFLELRAKGLGFIGDPHIWSRCPGRRLDECFYQTVLDSLTECIEKCNEQDLVPVILGDLLHDESESDWLIFNGLLHCFFKAKHPVWVVVGNHEKKQSVLTEDTMLSGLRNAGAIKTIEKSGSAFILKISDNESYLIGGTPYGQDFPETVENDCLQTGAQSAVWVSHHDLQFEGVYPAPSVRAIPEIKGVRLLVNGHMHKTMKPEQFGAMTAWNPGNITPMSIDALGHRPALWQWLPSFGGTLVPFYLKYDPAIFDASGYEVEPEELKKEDQTALGVLNQSLFTQLLLERTQEDRKKTDDAVFLKEEMEGLFAVEGTRQEIRGKVMQLLVGALEQEGK